ncbi:GNAT family N-acetyltransferase [Yinghuangia sp. YIM S09857]|uniref:GNAT family N-acetyltransferase n=1 Tax=Yinghuangia sp. YIM S09857 TaxID=3436929 RepID=UPI003F52969F
MNGIDVHGMRLRLRELAPGDEPGVLAIYGDREATRHLSFEPRSAEEVAGVVAGAVRSAGAEPRVEYVLAAVPHDAPEDIVGITRLATEPQRAATIGFALRPDSWGQGFGTEVVHLLCALGFGQLGLHRIWAARSPLNTASAETLRKAGMTEDGRIRDHVHVRGAWRDSIFHAILEHEWKSPWGSDSPRITHFAWGEIDAEGLARHKDLKVYPGGGRAWDWNETGTRHSPGVQVADVAEFAERGCEVVVLTRGVDLRLEVPDATVGFLRAKGIDVLVSDTASAITEYNRLVAEGRAVGGLFHTTC